MAQITKKSVDFAKWYTEVILKAELADYGPVKGCMVIRPYGYALWEKIHDFLDQLIKEKGVSNAYFPLFIPESFLKKEKEHIKGFAPHLAVVTIAGGEELKEKLVVRPTSETIMYEMYKQWYHSYRDLPVLINQWNNIVRWEKRTYLFLRTSEFLWQEGHCAHQTHEENLETVLWALGAYQKTYNDLMALYGIAGVKSETEKFAGADRTYSFEILMPDGKALQSCTSHDLGQNFAKAFDWSVQDKNGGKLYPFQNSWGLSTRSIGGLLMAHGDDAGLVLPSRISPIQVVIVPIPGSSPEVFKYADKIKEELRKENLRVKVDLEENESAGFKFNKWELKGVPLRIEIGEKEMASKTLTAALRYNHEKRPIKIEKIKGLLEEIQKAMFAAHKKFTEDHTYQLGQSDQFDKFKEIMQTTKGFVKAFWCENPECERKIKEETKATTRCLPIEIKTGEPLETVSGKCIYCGKESARRWLFAQAY